MPSGYTFKVLVAEDEQTILEHIVEKIGYTDPSFHVIATATNGEDALKLVEQHRPDVLFTDVKMPLMDGIELIRLVKKLFPEIHVVILSGFDNFNFAQQALKLGVSDYLLKPIISENLRDTLHEIKGKLEQRNMVLERTIITQDLNGIHPVHSDHSALQNEMFVLHLICLGNLYRYAANELDTHSLSKIRGMLEWSQLLHDEHWSTTKWWIIDEKNDNVKFHIMTTNPNQSESTVNMTLEIQKGISRFMKDAFSVTLCTHLTPVPFGELWEMSQSLRKCLGKFLVPCQSSIITSGDLPQHQDINSYLDQVTLNAIQMLVKQRKFDQLVQELARLFEGWKQNNLTQETLERALVQIVRFIFVHLEEHNQTAVEIEARIYSIVATTKHIDTLYQDILQLIGEHLPVHQKLDSAKELYMRLEEYIRLNFTKPINVEYLANKFQFNASYISRVFKKYQGVPPLQHLISMRIQEAKRLIKEKPELDFKDISEIIGFNNQHYFSKVFRSRVGLNPSEYRDLMKSNRP
ncbi:hypothetical protein C8Z91_22990 [Paenibacillus elgii]|uniref:Two-component system response regulator n=1 Tax=Paenibacillus elgii TaxID=189691 RepID=A0A2T6FY83_9BACL|nr:response regulator [Paenibacillus elgii]PUA36876.1 hypothetical protein C8Z91_22990 [Paenibacillus elgii]